MVRSKIILNKKLLFIIKFVQVVVVNSFVIK